MVIGILAIIFGIGVVLWGMVLIGRDRRRFIGSLTVFIGLNVGLLGYTLTQDTSVLAPDNTPGVSATPLVTPNT